MRPHLALTGWVLFACALGAQDPPPFRSAVDLIRVDAQVIDANGAPIGSLAPDQFEVSIDGKRRKVVSADFLRFAVTTTPIASVPPSAVAPVSPSPSATAAVEEGRVYIVAFDAMSFPPLAVAPARDAARKFIENVQPNDLVGLVSFPDGPLVDVTTDRARLLQELDRLTGQAAPSAMNKFGLTPSEIVDISKTPPCIVLPDENRDTCLEAVREIDLVLANKLESICSTNRLPRMACARTLLADGAMMARFEAADVARRLGAFQSVLKSLAGSPRRKIVMLVSAGAMLSDKVGGEPDLGDVGRLIGQSAAEGNSVVYSLFFDRVRLEMASASSRAPGRASELRDATIMSNSLHRMADTSGGSLFNVTSGAEFAFDRVLNETSSYYLLGVEPAASDRDGRPHQVQVKVPRVKGTVRARSWVTLPTTPATASAAGAPPVTRAVLTPATAMPRPLPPPVRALADAYAAKDYAGVQQQLAKVSDLANFIRDYQSADAPWPQLPRRARVFELELALAGLSSDNGFAQNEAVKLLTHSQSIVERSAVDDPFACSWFLTEAAALTGMWQPGLAVPLTERALRLCSKDPRLRLTHAMAMEQEWRQQRDPARLNEILTAYEAVPGDSEVGLEARVRGAWLAYQNGFFSQALSTLPETAGPSQDKHARYLYGLVKGHALRALGNFDQAAAAYQQALDEWPGAQSARVALMTLFVRLGRGGEAAALADAVQTAPGDQTDPWWTYQRGEARNFTELMARLRALAN